MGTYYIRVGNKVQIQSRDEMVDVCLPILAKTTAWAFKPCLVHGEIPVNCCFTDAIFS